MHNNAMGCSAYRDAASFPSSVIDCLFSCVGNVVHIHPLIPGEFVIWVNVHIRVCNRSLFVPLSNVAIFFNSRQSHSLAVHKMLCLGV